MLSWAGFGCVPERAGYEDVRRVTAARLGTAATWHESDDAADKEVAQLVAQPLDVERAMRVALLQNRELQAGFEGLGVARAEWVAALRLPNPVVAGALRYGADERPEVELEATIALSDLLFLASRSGVGERGLDAAKWELAGQAVDLAFTARAAFYSAQASVQRVELSREVLGALQAAAEMAEALHQAGNITDVEWRSQTAAFQQARVELARNEALAVEQREALNVVLGLSGESAARWTLVPELPGPLPIDELVRDVERRAVEHSLELEVAKARFAAAARRANLSRFEGWFPELHAGVSAERGEGDFAVGPLVELEVPLFYQGQAETAGALSEMRRQAELATAIAVRVRSRARALAARLSTSERTVAFYRDVLLPTRRQLVTDTQLQYNAMNTGVFQLLTAKREESLTATAELEARLEYWTLRTELERVLAGGTSRLGVAVGPASLVGAGGGETSAH